MTRMCTFCNNELGSDPNCPKCARVRSSDSEGDALLEGPLPVYLNLGESHRADSVIGWAKAEKNDEGRLRLTITFDEVATEQFTDLAAIFELKALGFAGIQRKKENSDGR